MGYKWAKHIVIALLIMLQACQSSERWVDWYPYYDSSKTTPYGTSVFKDQLENVLVNSQYFQVPGKTEAFFEEFDYQEGGTYFYIHSTMMHTEDLTETLLDHCSYGNTLFLACQKFNHTLRNYGIKTLTIKDTAKFHYLKVSDNEEEVFNMNKEYSNTTYFSNVPDRAVVLGNVVIENDTFPNFISLSIGDGYLLLHSDPELFTNYMMLHKAQGLYALNTLEYIGDQAYLIWDGENVYNRFTRVESSGSSSDTLRFIKSSSSLYSAFLILIFGTLVFLAFNYKRVLSVSGIYKKKKNASQAFVTMISQLYMSEDNHADIAKHRVNFILDQIRTKYYLDIAVIDDKFRDRLAEKTKQDASTLNGFVYTLNKIKKSKYLNKKDFINLSRSLELYVQKINLYHGNK